MEIVFQKGEYPIKQVIFCNLDSVVGGLFTSTILKPKYGKIDIIHSLRESKEETDVALLLKTTLPVVSTCWDVGRTKVALARYLKVRGWKAGDVRVYTFVDRIL